MSTPITEHFSLEEMTYSKRGKQLGIVNIPDDALVPNLVKLCTLLLEPIRVAIGMPVLVNSGYRCPQLNAAVGGVINSAHMDARAADIVFPGWDLNLGWEKIKDMDLPFDQLIWEKSGLGSQWIHIAVAKDGEEPRKQVLYLQARPNRKFPS